MPDEIPEAFRQMLYGIHLEDGWYSVLLVARYRNQNRPMTLPLQVIGGKMRVVTEWMVQFDKTDRQVKQAVELDPRRLQKMAPPMMGADYMYQGSLPIPDSVELESPDNEDLKGG